VLRAVVDARAASHPQLRGGGWYVKALVSALRGLPDLHLQTVDSGWPGPEVLFEAFGLARRARGADVIHAPNCFLPLRRRCAGVVTIHDLAFEEYRDDFARTTGAKYRAWTPRAVRSAQRVIVPSTFTRDDVVRRYGISQSKIRIIPEAPVLPITDSEPPPAPYILAVGDLRRKKNFTTLARAYAAGGFDQRLVIAGVDAGEGAAIGAAAGGAPIELPGYVSDAQLDALIRGADLVVHPSLYEGFGLIVAEAMARGIPLAVANATALPETAGDAAVLFDPANPDALAQAMREAIQRRDELGAAGRRRAAAMSWAEAARQTAAVYREAAAA
jgi:glycosyltransferase involved in cell wall biosynthesis